MNNITQFLTSVFYPRKSQINDAVQSLSKLHIITGEGFPRKPNIIIPKKHSTYISPDCTYHNLNVIDGDEHFQIKLSAPKCSRRNFNVVIENNKLLISDFASPLSKEINLPPGLNKEKVTATYDEGILYVNVPKEKGFDRKVIEVRKSGFVRSNLD